MNYVRKNLPCDPSLSRSPTWLRATVSTISCAAGEVLCLWLQPGPGQVKPQDGSQKELNLHHGRLFINTLSFRMACCILLRMSHPRKKRQVPEFSVHPECMWFAKQPSHAHPETCSQSEGSHWPCRGRHKKIRRDSDFKKASSQDVCVCVCVCVPLSIMMLTLMNIKFELKVYSIS